MKKVMLFVITVLMMTSCSIDPGYVCTDEFRMVTVTVKGQGAAAVVLDSSYTVRQSNNERITPAQQSVPGYYVVLDDSYHPQLRNNTDNFRFVGWKNNQKVADTIFRITADKCHIYKVSGPDTLAVQ